MIQLKIRTEYSFGQTYAPIDRVITRLKEMGCTAAGMVDNNTWGHVAWHKACTKAGIKPLLGVSCVVEERSMWFLAKNKKGLSELYNAISQSYHQKLKTKRGAVNRLYRQDVIAMSANIIKFAGETTDGKFLKACKSIIDLDPSSRILNHAKSEIAERYGLMFVEVSDNSYVYQSDESTFEIASRSGLKVTPQYILDELSYQGNAEQFVWPCKIPHAKLLQAEGDLSALCRKGIKHRKLKMTKAYKDRLAYELGLIRSKNFESYFIIVADMVQYAKQHMLVGPSRGSAAGSLVCYLTRITEIDPIPASLFFERFIEPSREDLPDIDLDFPDKKRHLVFEYMAEKYGASNVAHIGTISRYKPRSALIQVCKALSIPPQATGAVKSVIIERSKSDVRASKCLEDTFMETAPGREFIRDYPQAKVATKLEGHASHTGKHAAGLLVCDDDITNYAVVDDKGIAHVEKGAAEELGLLKIDVLGLRTLSMLEDSGVDIDWYNLKFDDEATFEVFNKQRFCGIFQFEGRAMRGVASEITFKTIDDIDVAIALARPGPLSGGVTERYIKRMNGQKYDPMHPLVEKLMANTYGLPVYQEQTFTIVREIGGFDWKETTAVRKAISKSLGREILDPYWEKFKKGAVNEADALKIWKMIIAMGAYQMNKAHTFSYAVVSYWTAYLKAHHPLEFAAANLRNAKDEDSAILLLREMKQEGIDHIAFDVDKSEMNWSVKDGKLYGGFTALKGIGEITAKKMIASRKSGSLTAKQLEKIHKAVNPFNNIFPFHTNYQDLYDNPQKHGVVSEISEIADIVKNVPLHKQERVFLGEVVYTKIRNWNEAVNVKKRGGVKEEGPLEYLDIRLRDDHDTIGGRIGRFDYKAIGDVPVGAHIMVRAVFYNNIPWAFIKKWRQIDTGIHQEMETNNTTHHSDCMETNRQMKTNIIHHGDCLDVMKTMPTNSIDSIITDPPYALEFMGKGWDKVLPSIDIWKEALRVAKPGAILMAFGGSRTYHRLTCSIEDAGWEIRDCMMWMYGSGFPKSYNISKGIDKAVDAEREILFSYKREGRNNGILGDKTIITRNITVPATDDAKLWEGWGTVLKPAYEPIVIAMKPLDGTFVNNALTHGVAGLNIDGGRVEPATKDDYGRSAANAKGTVNAHDGFEGKSFKIKERSGDYASSQGRFPANVVLDKEAGALLDEQSGVLTSGKLKGSEYIEGHKGKEVYGQYNGFEFKGSPSNSGGASRFFYCAKASKSERNAGLPEGMKNTHPTVKPQKLMEYLCTLTKTPTGGIVLDPFCGSGSTLKAAKKVGREYIGIDIDDCEIAKRRI